MTSGITHTSPAGHRRLRIAMIGTRGVPAAYGGFETAVEEIGRRLVDRGHEVTVYCRRTAQPVPKEYLGMTLVELPSLRHKILETLSHTGMSVLHAILRRPVDVAFVFNAANAPFVPWLRLRGIPTVVHVDGLEWRRGKWGGAGRRYYRWAEQVSVREADALIADSQGIADYYRDEFAITTELISYGTRILHAPPADRLFELGLRAGAYHLVVARFEPENHVDVIVEGYRSSGASLPLVVVGSAPYAADHSIRIADLAASDSRIHMLGGIWDQDQLDQLYAHARTYLHGHSVGGTNPSLLRAMGAGTEVIAWDVTFNREALGGHGTYFTRTEDLSALIEDAELNPERSTGVGAALQRRAEQLYDWDKVTLSYESLARRVAVGYSTHRQSNGRRGTSTWNRPDALAEPSTTAPQSEIAR